MLAVFSTNPEADIWRRRAQRKCQTKAQQQQAVSSSDQLVSVAERGLETKFGQDTDRITNLLFTVLEREPLEWHYKYLSPDFFSTRNRPLGVMADHCVQHDVTKRLCSEGLSTNKRLKPWVVMNILRWKILPNEPISPKNMHWEKYYIHGHKKKQRTREEVSCISHVPLHPLSAGALLPLHCLPLLLPFELSCRWLGRQGVKSWVWSLV